MATAEAEDDGFEFLSDPAARFPLPDLGGGDSTLDGEHSQILVCTAADSSIGYVGYAALIVQVDLNNTCEVLSLAESNSSEESTGKDDPQALGWTKRVHVGHAPTELLPCAG